MNDAGRLAALLENAQTLVTSFDGRMPPAEMPARRPAAHRAGERGGLLCRVPAVCGAGDHASSLTRIRPISFPGLPALRSTTWMAAHQARCCPLVWRDRRIKATCAGFEEAGCRLRAALETHPNCARWQVDRCTDAGARQSRRRVAGEPRRTYHESAWNSCCGMGKAHQEDGDRAFVALDDLLVEPGKAHAT